MELNILTQVISTCIMGLFIVGISLTCTWPSSTFDLFKSPNTTLHRPLAGLEIPMFGSLPLAAAILGTGIIGLLIDKLGRKRCLLMVGLIGVLSWTIKASTTRVEAILAATFIGGLHNSAYLCVSVWISEFAHDSIRGALVSTLRLFHGFGTVISFTLGGFLSYKTFIYVCLTLSVLSLVLASMINESPVFLLMKGMRKEASKSVAFFWRIPADSTDIQKELNKIQRTIEVDEEDHIPEEEKLQPTSIPKKKTSFFEHFKKSPTTRRAFLVNIVLVTAVPFQGIPVVQVYAEPLFKQVVPSISPTLCSIMFAITVTVATGISAYLNELIGRKPIMVWSSAATGVCHLIIGSQIIFQWAPAWATLLFVYIFCFIFMLGGAVVPYVIMAEIYSAEVRGIMSMIVLEWSWLCEAIVVFLFPPLFEALGIGPIFFIFSSVSFFAALFSIFFLPETKSLPIDEIQKLFRNKKHQDYIHA